MVARRMRRHPARQFVIGQPEHRIAGTPHLERARLLKILALKEQLGPGQIVQVAGC